MPGLAIAPHLTPHMHTSLALPAARPRPASEAFSGRPERLTAATQRRLRRLITLYQGPVRLLFHHVGTHRWLFASTQIAYDLSRFLRHSRNSSFCNTSKQTSHIGSRRW